MASSHCLEIILKIYRCFIQINYAFQIKNLEFFEKNNSLKFGKGVQWTGETNVPRRGSFFHVIFKQGEEKKRQEGNACLFIDINSATEQRQGR